MFMVGPVWLLFKNLLQGFVEINTYSLDPAILCFWHHSLNSSFSAGSFSLSAYCSISSSFVALLSFCNRDFKIDFYKGPTGDRSFVITGVVSKNLGVFIGLSSP